MNRPFSEPHSYLDVGHSRLAYYRFGRGPDVVFVHGWPLHSATFRHVVPLLERDFTCHLFDLPGTGKTHWDAGSEIGVREGGDTVRRAIDALGLERFALVAHDSGAVFARLAAAGDPRVQALVLGNTEIPGHRPWLVELLALAMRVPGGGALLMHAMRSQRIRRSFLGFGDCFADPASVDGEFFDLFLAPLQESKRAAAGQLQLMRALDWSVIDALDGVHARISAPVRLVWGELDPFFPLDKARKMAAQFPGGAEIDVIEGAKLFAHEDFPDQFAAHTRRFLLERLSASPDSRMASRASHQSSRTDSP